MSLEKVISELNANVLALHAVIGENSALLKATLESREQALAKLGAAPAAEEKPTRTRKSKTEDKPAAEEPKAEEPKKVAEEPKKAAKALPATEDLRTAFGGYLSGADDETEVNKRKAFVKAIISHFGKKPAELGDTEEGKQALFYLARQEAGLKVDFNAEYNFDEDPLFDQSSAADDDDDLMG